MKITKTASGKKIVKMSKFEWQEIGIKAGWFKKLAQGTVEAPTKTPKVNPTTTPATPSKPSPKPKRQTPKVNPDGQPAPSGKIESPDKKDPKNIVMDVAASKKKLV